MPVTTRTISYSIDGKDFEGFMAAPGAGPAPTVLIFHAWAGRSDFENDKARDLAELGYVGIAVDLFGKGVLGQSREENQALIAPFVGDRPFLQARLKATIAAMADQPEVSRGKMAAIGFCFGGLCALDIARSGGDVAGVVSFHGLLNAPGNTIASIKPKVLALHGWDDPMATPDDVNAFAKEMSAANADWQLHAYGNTMHAFTNPEANDPDFGTVYEEKADKRSWTAMKNFLAEIFA